VPVIIVRFERNLKFLDIPKYLFSWPFVQWEPSSSMWTARQTYRHAANSLFPKFYESY